MRDAFGETIISQCNKDNSFFLTGDLGFMALENVREAFGERFINAGVAEQNMIGVAAGLAREGFTVYAYSIAPFIYARPYEQIRNDICFSALPVCLIGNGGGYAYGHMGPTHHALEDCSAMQALGVKVLVPSFDKDLPLLLATITCPTYLRLGYQTIPEGCFAPKYSAWREVLTGSQGVLAALGPLAGVAWQALLDFPSDRRPSVWAVSEFDEEKIPKKLLDQAKDNTLFVIEEHCPHGGLGMHLALALAKFGVPTSNFVHKYALGYPSGRFGSQAFHRRECGIDVVGIQSMVNNSIK